MRVMKEKNLVFGVDEVPNIPIVEFIQPDEIDLMHSNYVIMDGMYYSFLYIKGDGYPQTVRANWMSNFINAGEGIDVDVFLNKVIIAPIKGHEFIRACNWIGGTFISIAPGSPHCINIMEIRHTESTELVDTGYPEMESRLSKKLQQLMIFFGLLVPDLTNEEEQIIDDAIVKTYQRFGITHDNNSIFEDNDPDSGELKTMPVLGDLYDQLSGVKGAKRVSVILSRFVTGSAQSFNRQTNVDLTNKYVVLDLSELKGNLLPIGMMIALDYVWDTVKADRTQKKAVFIDEIWQLVGASSTRTAAGFCLTIFKTIRGFGGAAIAATQDLSDFFGLDDGKYGRAIINNSQNKIILNLEPDEAKYVEEVLKLTKNETRLISHFNRGEALICSNNNKVPVNIIASKKEEAMITTDREELEKIYRAGRGIGSA